MTDRYAVFGNPIEHSLSPVIHTAFAAQTGQAIDYQRHCIDVDKFSAAVEEFFNNGGCGLNITVPFKLEAYRLVQELSQSAQRAGAVNTLYKDGGRLTGDNTDGIGLCNDLQENLKWSIKDSRVLVLGAGGAVRGILLPLLEAGPVQVIIANRTLDKAVKLVSQFGTDALDRRIELHAHSFEEIRQPFDIVINGTSASLDKQLPPISPRAVSNSLCYDMMYAATPTTFLSWAAREGAKSVADGLGMLVEQAAESFYIWRGVRPQTQSIIAELRDSL